MQNRMDERTAAGKRAFIRWHKAANDMIKSQLQQKLSKCEKSIQTKDEQLQKLTVDVTKLTDETKKLTDETKKLKEQKARIDQDHNNSNNKASLLLRPIFVEVFLFRHLRSCI